jgi:hypothetical protein
LRSQVNISSSATAFIYWESLYIGIDFETTPP